MRRWLAVLALTLLLALPAAPAGAEGPGTGGRRVVLEGEQAGPYVLRVVTSPTPPRVDNLYLEVRVELAASGAIVTDALVLTQAVFETEAEPSLQAEATHDIAPIPTEYAAHLPVTATGVWQVTVHIEGEQGTGEVSFPVRITGSTAIGTGLAVGLPVAGLISVVVLFLWLQRHSQREQGEAPETRGNEER